MTLRGYSYSISYVVLARRLFPQKTESYAGRRMNEGGKLRYALGGLEAGVLGALGMLAVFAASAIADRRSWWLVPNLIATAFHGPDAYTASFTRSTLTGIGFWLLLYGFLGVIWGLLWGERPV